MTGADLCREHATTISGVANTYDPGERLITLRPHVYRGATSATLTLAAHEAGHALQHRAIGWLVPAARWLLLGRLLLEWDASRRARTILRALDVEPDEQALRDSWRSYAAPAVWQTGAMVGLFAFALYLKR